MYSHCHKSIEVVRFNIRSLPACLPTPSSSYASASSPPTSAIFMWLASTGGVFHIVQVCRTLIRIARQNAVQSIHQHMVAHLGWLWWWLGCSVPCTVYMAFVSIRVNSEHVWTVHASVHVGLHVDTYTAYIYVTTNSTKTDAGILSMKRLLFLTKMIRRW